MKSPSIHAVASRQLSLPLALGLAAAGLLLGAVRATRADMAPFPAQEGNSLGPAASTNIQMISETVLIQLTEFSNTVADTSYPILGAKVVAEFAMRNPGNAYEALEVGFPLQVPKNAATAGDYVKITNLAAFADGVAVETQPATVGGEIWSAWQMKFAPGDTHVRITYDLPATTDACNAELGYVLHTGAAWAGPIGRADLIVRYPYPAEATFVSPRGIYLGDTTPGYQVEGSDLHWRYDNLEPTVANDLAVTFVAPECWLKVAAAPTALNQLATAENYWHLATAYADIVFPHHGFYSPLIAQVAEAQYQKALALEPENPQINAEYAEFLQAQVGNLLPAGRKPDEIRQCIKAMPLAPHDDQLLWACGTFLASQMGDPSVSAAVQATVAAVLTAVPQPTIATVVPSATETSAPATSLSPAPRPTASPIAIATQTASPQPTATPIAVAQITAMASPTQLSASVHQPGAGLGLTIGLLAVGAVILIACGVYYVRRRPPL
jgi:hypothetical protein